MNPETTAGTDRTGRLARAAAPLLSLLILLRRSRDLDAFAELPQTVDQTFQEFRQAARQEGVPAQDIDDASYAMAAALDETMLSARWAGREEWQRNNLARRYCNDEFVGDGFYDKLAEIRRATTPRREVEEIFYYCLISGFQGRLIEVPVERDDLIADLATRVGSSSEKLAPHGLPHREGGALAPIKRFPWPMVAIACVVVPVLFWLISWNVLDDHADGIVDELNPKIERALGED